MPVQGMGGLFFRAHDPEALAEWYKAHLGVGGGCAADGMGEAGPWEWLTAGGPMVFQPVKADTDYFPAEKAFMLNFRVTGLDALIASLTAAGIAVETRPEWNSPEAGRFARIQDPEGTPIELWEAPAD